MRRQTFIATAVMVAVVVLTAACSATSSRPSERSSPLPASTTPPPARVACPARARATFRAAAGGSVRVVKQVDPGLTTCEYRAAASTHRTTTCTFASLRIDTASQALVDFHRYVDEAVQNSSVAGQTGLAPIQISAPELGPEVDWVPARRMLDTAVAGRWITVIAQCAAGDARSRSVARRLALTAVG